MTNEERLRLLDPDVLPEGLTYPVEGKFRSTDVEEVEFIETNMGNTIRVDHLAGGGEHHTFIPNTEGWRKGVEEERGVWWHKQVSATKAIGKLLPYGKTPE